jgi:hypothetical protein
MRPISHDPPRREVFSDYRTSSPHSRAPENEPGLHIRLLDPPDAGEGAPVILTRERINARIRALEIAAAHLMVLADQGTEVEGKECYALAQKLQEQSDAYGRPRAVPKTLDSDGSKSGGQAPTE